MKKSNYIVKSLMNAAGVFVYVLLVAWLISRAENIFGNQEDRLLIPVFMLILFIISAAITGFLVLGRPILMYLDNQKKEAVVLFGSTIAWLLVFLFFVMSVLVK